MRKIGLSVLCGASLFALQCAAPTTGVAAPPALFTVGRPVAEVLRELRSKGLRFVFSENLLPESIVILREPVAEDPIERVNEVLAPHGLVTRKEGGYQLVIRMPHGGDTALADPDRAVEPRGAQLEVITVSASRYDLARQRTQPSLRSNQRAIESLPDLGNDPIRALQRLPGAAAGGTSAKTHFRGGDENETGIILNGYRLLDPFHVRDYHSLFSAIDTRALDGMEVYSGGFPARYGDRMSGMVLIDSLTPEKRRRAELGLSVFNTSVLSAGLFDDNASQWLVSARRSNLNLVLNKDLGEPKYYDVFGELTLALSADTRLTVNGLIADDRVVVATENDVDERENSSNDTNNRQLWFQLEHQWTDALSMTAMAFAGRLDSSRIGSNQQPEKVIGSVSDQRDIEVAGLRQDWSFALGDRHIVNWGGQFQHLSADYDYAAEARYFGFYDAFASTPSAVARDSSANVDGEIFALYVSDRWRIANALTLEAGVRWDRQTYTTPTADEQTSPRLHLLYAIRPNLALRASWGRYYQSQDVHELLIEDGETDFHPAQRADHLIVGLQKSFTNGLKFRAELYRKNMRSLRPRYENLFDPLAIIPELEPDRVRVTPEKARSEGLELSLSSEHSEGLSWWAAYVLARVEDTIDGVQVPRSWDQRHALDIGLNYQTGRWQFSAAVGVHSGWPRTRLLIDPASDPDDPELVFGERNARHFKTYAALDLRVARRFQLPVGSLNAFFELSNATNRRNPCCVDYDLEEIGGETQLVSSKEYWLPILPALGVLWEF